MYCDASLPPALARAALCKLIAAAGICHMLRFLGIILRVLRLEVSGYSVYITNQFQTTFVKGGEEVKSVVKVSVNSKEENS